MELSIVGDMVNR